MKKIFAFILSAVATIGAANAEEVRPINRIDSGFNLIGPNHGIQISAIADNQVPGVFCAITAPSRGGLKGLVNKFVPVFEEKTDIGISCRQHTSGTLSVPDSLKTTNPVNIVEQYRGGILRVLKVYRVYDAPTNSLIYLAMTDTLISGSPKSSISIVPLNK